MEYVLWLDEVTKDSGSVAGGKAANLGEMISFGLPVPQGFIVTTKAFEKFVESIKQPIQQMIDACDVEDTQKLLDTSKMIKELVLKRDYPMEVRQDILQAYNELSVAKDIKVPKALDIVPAGREYAIVAIRSSATTEDLVGASFAGQMASFLNVKGVTNFLDAVKKCWASLYEPRAIFYRQKHGFRHSSIAVIVQRMIASEKSGVMFTCDPSTGEDIIIIEACWGVGETLVSGAVQPDLYKASKQGEMLNKKIGKKNVMRVRDAISDRTIELDVPKDKVSKQVLAEDEIFELVKYGVKIEDHYGMPQDIEWCVENNRIYIVQTRAVTTKARPEKIEIKAKHILKGLGVSPGVVTGVVRTVSGISDIPKVKKGDILVTTMTSPDLVPTMSKCSAIITESGGQTCHAAIVSREMGIPAIVGTHTATKTLKDGQLVTVDAYNGFVYSGKVEINRPEKEKAVRKKTKTKIKVNVAFPEVPEEAKTADGVGLLRIEHMIIKSGIHPAKLVRDGRTEEYIKILTDGIRPIAKAFKQKPIWVRTLDARSDEFRNLQGGEDEPHEDNPMLGWHGIRRSLDEPDLLKAEFEAIKRLHEEGFTNLHVMLPFIVSVDEFVKAKQLAEQVGLNCKLGIMIETASAALIIEDFCKAGIAFGSVGSNDLTQSVLCVDRNNDKIAGLYDTYHPAVLKLIKNMIAVCKKYGVESSICGEAGSEEKMAETLVKYGIDSISVNMDALDRVRAIVAKTEKE